MLCRSGFACWFLLYFKPSCAFASWTGCRRVGAGFSSLLLRSSVVLPQFPHLRVVIAREVLMGCPVCWAPTGAPELPGASLPVPFVPSV